jgi:hypothetical protein
MRREETKREEREETRREEKGGDKALLMTMPVGNCFK